MERDRGEGGEWQVITQPWPSLACKLEKRIACIYGEAWDGPQEGQEAGKEKAVQV